MLSLEEKIAEWRKRMAAGGVKDPAVLGELESHLRKELRERLSDGDSEIEAFEFAEAISEWRQQMLAAGIRTPIPLEELESHLREEIEQQTKAGIDEQQAFKLAVERIGQSHSLKAEFAKVTGIKGVQWGKVVGIVCWLVAFPFPALSAPGFLMAPELTTSQRLLGWAAVLLTFLSLASGRFSHRFLPVIDNRKTRLKATITCGLAGLAWLFVVILLLFRVIVPHFFSQSNAWQRGEIGPIFTMGIAALWAMALTAVLGAIAYGLEEAARRQRQKDVYV